MAHSTGASVRRCNPENISHALALPPAAELEKRHRCGLRQRDRSHHQFAAAYLYGGQVPVSVPVPGPVPGTCTGELVVDVAVLARERRFERPGALPGLVGVRRQRTDLLLFTRSLFAGILPVRRGVLDLGIQ